MNYYQKKKLKRETKEIPKIKKKLITYTYRLHYIKTKKVFFLHSTVLLTVFKL